jgi:DNA-binding CsgD family transcriptional regulator
VTAPTVEALDAERAWLDGDALTAIAAADRVLEAGTDVDGRAAGVAAAAAAADGALGDAAARWRAVAATLDGTGGAWAVARAALAAALTGDTAAAAADLDRARDRMPDPAPRGLTLLVDGTAATLEAMHGGIDPAARRLAGLAAATVPPDALAPEQWGELAATVAAAGGHDRAARAMLAPQPGQPITSRRRLLLAWLDLRTGHLSGAREGLTATAGSTVLRRTAVLGAAVSVGLARRSGDEHALAATWMRVSPVVAGADVEPLLLDAWGELASAAARVAPEECAALVGAMSGAVAAVGSPWWAVAIEQWWRLDRAVAADAPAGAAAAAEVLAGLAVRHPGLRVRAGAATAFAAVLGATPQAPLDPDAVAASIAHLAAAGYRWEAAQLCRAATARTSDPAAARVLLEAGRRLGGARPSRQAAGPDALSDREREVGALVVDGLTHKEIGARLYLSPKTVEQHVAHLRRKLRASSRATLVAALRVHLDG